MGKIKRATQKEIDELTINTARPEIDPEKTAQHRISKGQHVDNPFNTLAELEAAKDTMDPQLYSAAKADLTREDRVASLKDDFPWEEGIADDILPEENHLYHDGTLIHNVICPMTVNKRPTGPVPQPGFVFADKVMNTAEQIADYAIANINAHSLIGEQNIFLIPLNLNLELLKQRADEQWTLESRLRICDLLEAAVAMICQMGERGRKLDNRIDELIPPMGPGKAYGIVSIFLDDDDLHNISLRITVQKGLR